MDQSEAVSEDTEQTLPDLSTPVTDEESEDTMRRRILLDAFVKPLMDEVLAKCTEFGVGLAVTFYSGRAKDEHGEFYSTNNSNAMPLGVTPPPIMEDIFLLQHHGYRAVSPDSVTLDPDALAAAVTAALGEAGIPMRAEAVVKQCDCPQCKAARDAGVPGPDCSPEVLAEYFSRQGAPQ